MTSLSNHVYIINIHILKNIVIHTDTLGEILKMEIVFDVSDETTFSDICNMIIEKIIITHHFLLKFLMKT